MPKEVHDLIPVFHACIQVGMLERAALVLQRVVSTGVGTPEEHVMMHNEYFGASIKKIRVAPDMKGAEELHKWYELYIRADNLPQTPETIAYMLKASLLTTHDAARLERLVNRYMGTASEEEGIEVLHCTDILSDSDRAIITNICPRYSLSAQEESLEATLAKEVEASVAVGSDAFPDVLQTDQKGVGLATVKKTLALFYNLHDGQDISKLSEQDRREFQSRLERDCVEAAVDRWRTENDARLKMGLTTSLSSPSLNSKCYEWQKALHAQFVKEFEAIDAAEFADKKIERDAERCYYGPFLRQSTPERLAAITILATITTMAASGVESGTPIMAIINTLAKVAEEDAKTQMRAKTEAHESRFAKARSIRAMRYQYQKPYTPSEDGADGPSLDPNDFLNTSWPTLVKVKVGAAMLLALIETAKITVVREHPETKQPISQLQSAFVRASQFRRGKRQAILQCHPALSGMMRTEPRADFLARHLPMVTEPQPWTEFEKGGYLEWPVPLVRIKSGEIHQKIYAEAALARGDMAQVTKGLDVLGKTAWRINKPVFKVMLDAWNTGEAIAKIPPLNPNVPIPPEPENADDPLQRRLWIKAIKLAENTKSGLHSNRCFMNFQLEIARAYRDQTFYFPHNIDFRGRAYPVPTYLNHMGADHVRGLLCFAKGKELGEAGLKWLKVHLSNVYGYDKASLKDRENFAMENLANITDSVNNPLNGKKWWLEAEDPWQCLATCFELKAALESPDPTKYVSQLPVHQDGTCNGLQHYAALGGDSWGARQVNLEPSDKPADVYTAVAELVIEGIEKDIAEGSALAKALEGKIKRKVVKQTVMTNVYGVTYSGARKQVMKQLDSLYPTIHEETGFASPILSSYIATKIFMALGTMFRGAHDIQFWLGEIGNRVCRALTAEQLERVVGEISATGKERRNPAGKKKPASRSKFSPAERLARGNATLARAQERLADAKRAAERTMGRQRTEASWEKLAAAEQKALTKVAALERSIAEESIAEEEERRIAEEEEKSIAEEQGEGGALAKKPALSVEKSATAAAWKAPRELLSQLRSTIIWTTPLRMPIVQPYRKSDCKVIKTCLQNMVLTKPNRNDPVNRRKQLQAFPPNFIHSLDASHMILSALECDELGLTFAAVHDSFWTHAADVDVMNRVLRDAFIRIHSEDVIGRLLAEFQARYKGGVYLAQVRRKTEAGKAIRAHRKNGKMHSLKDELVVEKKRLSLLNSDDPEKVEEGKKMVTPGSIFEKYSASATEDLVEKATEHDIAGLGNIPDSAEEIIPNDHGELLEEEEDVEAAIEAADEAEETLSDDPTKALEAKLGSTFMSQFLGSEAAEQKKQQKKKSSPTTCIQVWLPLTFPDIPKKGDFDVTKLKNSEYFFS